VGLAIQMGRPTKYTASGASCSLTSGISREISAANSNINTSSMSHLGCVITPWYQVPHWKSLLQQHLLIHHPSMHAADAVNPWLVMPPEVSLSPDSTVRDMEQTSNETESVTNYQLDALDLCQKSAASAVVPIRISPMPLLPANMSTSNVTVTDCSTENCARSSHTELARHWSHNSSTSSIIAQMDHSMSDPVLNLSVKSLELCREKSSRSAAATFSHTDSDSDSSGCMFYFVSCVDLICQLFLSGTTLCPQKMRTVDFLQ